MDAVKFVREEMRMCSENGDCCDCPLGNSIYCSVSPKKRSQEEAEEIVRRVEAWSIGHPRKTRQDAFLEQYPDAKCVDGNIYLCPKMIDTCLSCPIDCNDEFDCFVCKREFWSQEVE